MKATPQDPKPYYRRLLADNGLVEVRHKVAGQWLSYWFDNEDDLLACLRRSYPAGDLFTSLNALKPRVVRNGATAQEPLKNADIAWITRLPFDFDPERPVGTASTDGQLDRAVDLRGDFLKIMAPLGWGHPLLALSGNGYHAQYRCRLPNNAETGELLDLIYRGLREELRGNGANFDISVRNPGRIFRAYGSINRKGGAARRTTVWIPPRWNQPRTEQIAMLADYYRRSVPEATREHRQASAPKINGKGDYRTLDVARWLSAHGS
jgi:hypothetical protein